MEKIKPKTNYKHFDQRNKLRKVNNRIFWTACFFVFIFSAIVIKLFYLSIISNAYYINELNKEIYHRTRETFERSSIYDRENTVLALCIKKPTIYINPREIRSLLDEDQMQWFMENLSDRTNIDRESIRTILNMDSSYRILRRFLNEEEYGYIRELNVLAREKYSHLGRQNLIHRELHSKRVYPHGEHLRYILGRTDNHGEGKEGIELVFNDYLSQRNKNIITSQVTGSGRLTRRNSELIDILRDQYDLYLTISMNMQKQIEDINARLYEEHKPEWSLIIVQDAKNAEILAFSISPLPSANGLPLSSRYNNPAIIMQFEPGSTFKTLAYAYLIENGHINIQNKDNKVFCERGLYNYNRYRFRDVRPYEYLSFREIFTKSSNIGTIKISKDIPLNDWTNYLHQSGFGNRTGIRLPAEAGGSLGNLTHLKDEHSRLLSFIGHGISVSALQLLSFYQAIANDGVMIRPRIIRYLANYFGDNLILDNIENDSKRIFSKDTALDLRELLMDAVYDGTGRAAYTSQFPVGGKTGTAQIFDFDTNTYKSGQYVSSFIGIAPIDNPEVVIMVLVYGPSGEGYYGGAVAAPYFKETAEFSVKYIRDFN